MKSFLVLSLLCAVSLVFSQNETVSDSTVSGENSDNGWYSIVEVMPEFPGGTEALMKYLSENIVYPDYAKKHNIQGKVYVKFVINQQGKVEDINVLKSVDPLLDNEAVRVISAMPYWTPGFQKGKAVKVQYLVPIDFKLADGKQKDKKKTRTKNKQ